MTRPEHLLDEPDLIDGEWCLPCSCGWHSGPYAVAAAARAAGSMHVLDVLNSPSGVKALSPDPSRSSNGLA